MMQYQTMGKTKNSNNLHGKPINYHDHYYQEEIFNNYWMKVILFKNVTWKMDGFSRLRACNTMIGQTLVLYSLSVYNINLTVLHRAKH